MSFFKANFPSFSARKTRNSSGGDKKQPPPSALGSSLFKTSEEAQALLTPVANLTGDLGAGGSGSGGGGGGGGKRTGESKGSTSSGSGKDVTNMYYVKDVNCICGGFVSQSQPNPKFVPG